MGTYWHKEGWLPGELDPVTREPLPGAMPPGIYAEDQAAFDQLRRGGRMRSREMTATLDGAFRLEGQDVFLCTPEQAAMFRATATVTPEESLAAHQAGLEAWARARMAMTYEEATAEDRARMRAAQVQRLMDDRKAAEAAAAVKGDVIGANRKARRAAAAQVRRGA